MPAIICGAIALGVFDVTSAADYPHRGVHLHVPSDNQRDAASLGATALLDALSLSVPAVQLIGPSERRGRTSDDIVRNSTGAYHLMVATPDSHLIAAVFPNSRMPNAAPLIGVFETSPVLCVVSGKDHVNSLQELIASARESGKLRVSSAGAMTNGFFVARLSLRVANTKPNQLKLTHVALKSSAGALAAVLKGTARFACASATIAQPFIKARQLKVLLATSRVPGESFPTAASLDMNGFELFDSFTAIAAAKRADSQAIDRWQGWLTRVSQNGRYVQERRVAWVRSGRNNLMLRQQAQATIARRVLQARTLLERWGIDGVNKR